MNKNKEAINKETYQSFGKVFITSIIILIAVISSFLTFYILQFSLNTQTPVVVVCSQSMSPNINEGDLLFVQGKNPSDISVGDVIVFQADWIGAPQEPVVHRVVEIIDAGGELRFYTLGDNNDGIWDDNYRTANEIYGVVIGGIPYIGWVKLFFDRTGLLIPLIVLIVFFLIISIIWDYTKEREEQKRNEKEKFFEFKKDLE